MIGIGKQGIIVTQTKLLDKIIIISVLLNKIFGQIEYGF